MATLRKRNVETETVVQNVVAEEDDDDKKFEGTDKDLRMSLMEEILLLGLKDKEGHTSFWNDCISSALRGCILIELGLRGRIALESSGQRTRSLIYRRVVVKNEAPTGEALLDEALKMMKDDQNQSIPTWIEWLSGEVWNPLKMGYQLRNVRERLAKNLVEKGLLSTEKHNFVLFEMTTHPIINPDGKRQLIKKVQDSLGHRWSNDPHKMDSRDLGLLVMAQAADVIENALNDLMDDQYETASKRLRDIVSRNYEKESQQPGANEIMWGVFAAFNK